jgi:hypothetical protein
LQLIDEEAWKKYAFFSSVLGGVVVGSFAGFAVLPLLAVPSDALTSILAGWVLGIPIILSAGMLIAKSYPWL